MNTITNTLGGNTNEAARRNWFKTTLQAAALLGAGGAFAATAQASRNSRAALKFNAQAMSDRAAIEDMLSRYTTALDTKDWALLESVFTADAQADFSKVGGPAKPIASAKEITSIIKLVLGTLTTQHIWSNAVIKLEGDRASVTSYLIAYHWRKDNGMSFVTHGRYVDVFVREKTTGNWLIQTRALDPIQGVGDRSAVFGS
jgi:ketosteroid isomerase-like protein